MADELNYYSDVKDGKLQNNVRQLIAKELPNFNGKRVEITIKKIVAKRSLQQNKYWWVLVKIIADEVDYDKDTLHEILKYKFLKKEFVIEQTAEVVEYVGSTAKLNKNEYSELIFNLKTWALDTFGINLPEPGENFNLDLE